MSGDRIVHLFRVSWCARIRFLRFCKVYSKDLFLSPNMVRARSWRTVLSLSFFASRKIHSLVISSRKPATIPPHSAARNFRKPDPPPIRNEILIIPLRSEPTFRYFFSNDKHCVLEILIASRSSIFDISMDK